MRVASISIRICRKSVPQGIAATEAPVTARESACLKAHHSGSLAPWLRDCLLTCDRRQPLQVDRQMGACHLRLALLEQVQGIGPILNHQPASLDVLGMAVSSAAAVWIGMRELSVYPDLRIAQFIERCRNRSPDAVTSQPPIIA